MTMSPAAVELAVVSLAPLVAAVDLVGPREIAFRLGVQSNTVSTWTARHDDFPRPWLVISRVPLWPWAEVDAWALKHRRDLRGTAESATTADVPSPTRRCCR
jgi:predicted DNA-binding transcriptional regulator AlpA